MCLIKKKGVFVFMFLFISILTVFSPLRMEASKPSVGKHGMVSSAHPIATESGLTILKKGGNAFDAAVAIGATLNVVEPMMSGMGGYGTILVYVAKKDKIIFLDSSGRIPASLNSDVFRSPTPDYLKNRRGPKAVSTPGNVNAWESMSKKFGLLKWPELFEAAIKVAENGFVLDKRTSRSIARSFGDFPEHAKDFYGKDGRPLKKGERLIQKDLADSLRKVAKQGARAVYGGKLGKAIDEEMRKTGGFLSLMIRQNGGSRFTSDMEGMMYIQLHLQVPLSLP